MIHPKYSSNPIYKIESLTKALNFPLPRLEKLAENTSKYYRPISRFKKGGEERTVYSPQEALKTILKRIKTSIFDKVCYPDYLHGSIKGCSPEMNAEIHAGATRIIVADIADFFPSVKGRDIYRICRYFLNFSEEVSILLTKLVTYQDILPQGSPVSPSLANLALCWDGKESKLVESLRQKGLHYTRYIDDIAISYTKRLQREEETAVIKKVHAFVSNKGFRLNHGKTKVLNPTKAKAITGLKIGRGIGIPHQYIESVFQEVKQLRDRDSFDEHDIASTGGKINRTKRHNPKQACRLEKHLPWRTCK